MRVTMPLMLGRAPPSPLTLMLCSCMTETRCSQRESIVLGLQLQLATHSTRTEPMCSYDARYPRSTALSAVLLLAWKGRASGAKQGVTELDLRSGLHPLLRINCLYLWP